MLIVTKSYDERIFWMLLILYIDKFIFIGLFL